MNDGSQRCLGSIARSSGDVIAQCKKGLCRGDYRYWGGKIILNTQLDVITGRLTRARGENISTEAVIKLRERWTGRCCAASFASRRGCEPLNTSCLRKLKMPSRWFLCYSFQKPRVNSLNLAVSDPFWTSGFQNNKMMCLSCLKLQSLCSFLMVAVGIQRIWNWALPTSQVLSCGQEGVLCIHAYVHTER